MVRYVVVLGSGHFSTKKSTMLQRTLCIVRRRQDKIAKHDALYSTINFLSEKGLDHLLSVNIHRVMFIRKIQAAPVKKKPATTWPVLIISRIITDAKVLRICKESCLQG